MKNFLIGAAYYPEMWEEAEVDKDIERCREYGLNVLRVGEFAWSKMEPREGEYDFGWLLRTVDKLHRAGIGTVMCTPTCTPPRWLMNGYPEARRVGGNRLRVEVSSRVHTCKTSPLLRKKNRAIVTEMAKVFGKHPGVIGWQIDNEFYPYEDGCFCDLCKAAFREYLQKKYGTIEQLNEAWGTVRWSLTYDRFEDIDAPYPDQWRHPSLLVEWRRFQCDQIRSFLDEQADILHCYSDAPVGTDMMPNNLLGYYKTNAHLDVVQFNHYDTAAGVADPCFFYDFLRPIKERPFWVTETQVGWSGSHVTSNSDRPAGNCYVNTWLPIASGAEANMYWLFRTHPNGHELAHGAVFTTAGRPYRVSDEVRQAAADIEKCEDFLKNTRVKSKIALYYSETSELNFSAAPLLEGFHYASTVRDRFYRPLSHRNVDVIDEGHPLDGYAVVLSPFQTTVEGETRARLQRFVEEGGTWIVGPMSDITTDYMSKYTEAPFSFLEDYVGVYTKYQKPVGNDILHVKWQDGSDCGTSRYYDAFELHGASSLADYCGGEFDGLCAICERRIGKGRVILLGSVPAAEDLRRLVDVPPIAEASDNVRLVARSGQQQGLIALETADQEGTLTLTRPYTELITGRKMTGRVTLTPYEVLVLKEN